MYLGSAIVAGSGEHYEPNIDYDQGEAKDYQPTNCRAAWAASKSRPVPLGGKHIVNRWEGERQHCFATNSCTFGFFCFECPASVRLDVNPALVCDAYLLRRFVRVSGCRASYSICACSGAACTFSNSC